MSTTIETAELEIRERRLHSVITYHGTATDLNEKSKKVALKCGSRTYQQCSDCSQGCAETVTYLLKDAAVLIHSPIGCCSSPVHAEFQGETVTRARGIDPQRAKIICTNIREEDTIYGAGEKLKKAAREAVRRFNPAAIFIHSSCAASIIGEDLEKYADDLEDELGIKIIPVYCEGFRSRIWSTGFDAAYHGILRKIVQPPRKKETDLVNLFNFMGTDSFRPLLNKLGLRVNYLVPMADVETISRMSEAACSAHICETLATYVASVLEKQYGVPEVKAPAPFGIEWTDEWLRDIARHTGKEDIVEDVIRAEHERIQPELDDIREKLKGVRAYIFAGDSYAHSLANMATDLGLELIGLTTLHHDQTTDGGGEVLNTLGHLIRSKGEIDNYSVCNKQPYQVFKIVKKLQPDILIVRHMNMTILGTKLGIPAVLEGDVNVSAGYDGLVKLGRRLHEALLRKKVLKTIGDHVELPYTDWWLNEENPFYFDGGNEL